MARVAERACRDVTHRARAAAPSAAPAWNGQHSSGRLNPCGQPTSSVHTVRPTVGSEAGRPGCSTFPPTSMTAVMTGTATSGTATKMADRRIGITSPRSIACPCMKISRVHFVSIYWFSGLYLRRRADYRDGHTGRSWCLRNRSLWLAAQQRGQRRGAAHEKSSDKRRCSCRDNRATASCTAAQRSSTRSPASQGTVVATVSLNSAVRCSRFRFRICRRHSRRRWWSTIPLAQPARGWFRLGRHAVATPSRRCPPRQRRRNRDGGIPTARVGCTPARWRDTPTRRHPGAPDEFHRRIAVRHRFAPNHSQDRFLVAGGHVPSVRTRNLRG
jgi:hypothetical protein